jgi:Ras-related protein Rab-18
MEQYDHLLKILLVGDSNVGKTSLLLRFTIDDFKENIRSTVGVDLKVKLVTINGKKLKVTLWDTAGQERFRTLTSAYYRGAHGIILVYSISERETFTNLRRWIEEVDAYSTNENAVRMLVGNKSDQEQDRQVSKDEGIALAREMGMLFIEASAKTKEGVSFAFEELLRKILETPTLIESDDRKATAQSNAQLDAEDEERPSYGCC